MVPLLESFLHTEAGVGGELGLEETKADTYGKKVQENVNLNLKMEKKKRRKEKVNLNHLMKRMVRGIRRRLTKMRKVTRPDARVYLVLRLEILLEEVLESEPEL